MRNIIALPVVVRLPFALDAIHLRITSDDFFGVCSLLALGGAFGGPLGWVLNGTKCGFLAGYTVGGIALLAWVSLQSIE